MNPRVVLAIAQKDILDAMKNRYLLIALVLPVLMSLLLGLLFTSPSRMEVLHLAAYDPGESYFLERLEGLQGFQVTRVNSQEALLEQAAQDEFVAGVQIPEDFDQALQAGEQPELFVYQNQEVDPLLLSYLQLVVERQALQVSGIEFPVRIHWDAPPAQVAATNELAMGGEPSSSVFSIQTYILVLIFVMALSMAGGFVVPYLLVEEKEKRTLQALLLSPARPAEIILGKAMTGLFYSAIISAVLIALNQGWQGNWPVTLLALFLGALLIVSVGLLLGSLSSSTNQVNTWSSVVMLVLMLPSWIAPLSLPAYLRSAFRLIPTYPLASILTRALNGNAGLGTVWGDLLFLTGAVIVVFLLVVWITRRRAVR